MYFEFVLGGGALKDVTELLIGSARPTKGAEFSSSLMDGYKF